MIERIWSQPDIYRIEVPLPDNPLWYLNSYVLFGPERVAVIDTGFNRPECREALFTGLNELGVDFTRTDLFLTHLHADHTGLVGDFVARGSQVYMHPVDYQYLQDSRDESTWRYTETRFMEEGMPESEIKLQFSNHARAYSPNPDFTIHAVEDGQVITLGGEDATVLHTPGHTKGLCCLWMAHKGILFSSDHVLFDITPNIQVWMNMQDSLERYVESLDRVKDLPVKLVLPAHRKGRTSVKERVEEIKGHHRARLEEVRALIEAHPLSTAYDIAPHLTWSMRGKKWPEFPPTQKWFALGETLAHIEYLLSHGVVTRRCTDGLARYALTQK